MICLFACASGRATVTALSFSATLVDSCAYFCVVNIYLVRASFKVGHKSLTLMQYSLGFLPQWSLQVSLPSRAALDEMESLGSFRVRLAPTREEPRARGDRGLLPLFAAVGRLRGNVDGGEAAVGMGGRAMVA